MPKRGITLNLSPEDLAAIHARKRELHLTSMTAVARYLIGRKFDGKLPPDWDCVDIPRGPKKSATLNLLERDFRMPDGTAYPHDQRYRMVQGLMYNFARWGSSAIDLDL